MAAVQAPPSTTSATTPGDPWLGRRTAGPGTSPWTSGPKRSRCLNRRMMSSPPFVSPACNRCLRVAPQGTGHNAAPLGSLAGTVLVKTPAP